MTVTLRRLQGADLACALDDLAALRIAVFRDWPYLYDGDLAYERSYLDVYRMDPDAIVVAAYDRGAKDGSAKIGARMVGAATGSPLLTHAEDFRTAFADPPVPLDQIFYCAESVLDPAYRGHGIGHRFFDLREAHARQLGARFITFCAVIRPDEHPLRPAAARDLAPFWRKRGYAPLPGIVARFDWKDVDCDTQSQKSLQFWGRAL